MIPEIDVNGQVFYDNVTFKLNFATGTFELVGGEEKPSSISATPLDTMEAENIKMQFMGCTRSGRNEVTCHLKLTSLGGFDRATYVYANYSGNTSFLYDDLGNTYKSTEISVANLQATSAVHPTLIAGIPTLAKFKFTNISPNATSLSLFKPAFNLGDSVANNGNTFYSDFRNINF
ncbi:MAG: hypothetical protein GQ581_07030 [Methyloprofundus sp.]|nr:hypothetical protein [Methyloprofundus sp.]